LTPYLTVVQLVTAYQSIYQVLGLLSFGNARIQGGTNLLVPHLSSIVIHHF